MKNSYIVIFTEYNVWIPACAGITAAVCLTYCVHKKRSSENLGIGFSDDLLS